jgi:hypothetical protein
MLTQMICAKHPNDWMDSYCARKGSVGSNLRKMCNIDDLGDMCYRWTFNWAGHLAQFTKDEDGLTYRVVDIVTCSTLLIRSLAMEANAMATDCRFGGGSVHLQMLRVGLERTGPPSSSRGLRLQQLYEL